MKKLIPILILILLAGWIGTVVVKRGKEEKDTASRAAKAKAAPIPVLLTNATTMTMPVEIRTFGTVEPMSTVAVKSQITGILSNVLFSEGQEVKEGDLLFVIDPRPAEATLRQAEAALSRDRVQLENAVKEAERQESLLAKGISAQDVRDTAVTTAETLKAAVRADEAAMDYARLQVGYCSIRSPVSGRTGNLMIHRGNLVKADDAPLVTINQIHPILVRFTLPQQELARVRAGSKRGEIAVLATLSDAEAKPEPGILTFIDNTVEESTGTIQLKARFENATSALWPGQFATVVLQLARQENVVTVPETAIMPGQKGAYVYVKDSQDKVNPRSVTVDRTVSGISVITSGLTAGEEVVVDGQLRLKPGSLVTSRSSSSPPDAKPAGRP
ncbi:MAG: efflux RND transporter periplasmic adaptor subunit [bacterium]